MVMEKLTERKARILDMLDQEIELLEDKLRKVQPFIDELQQLKRTRATLLSERTTTGSLSPRTRLTLEQVVQALRENGKSSVASLAEVIGVDETVVRSHLNRYKDTRYRKNGDGNWELIGSDEGEE
jgi:hypothetical protein